MSEISPPPRPTVGFDLLDTILGKYAPQERSAAPPSVVINLAAGASLVLVLGDAQRFLPGNATPKRDPDA